MNKTFKAKNSAATRAVPKASDNGSVRAGCFNFFRHIRRRVPAAIGQIDEEQADEELDKRSAW